MKIVYRNGHVGSEPFGDGTAVLCQEPVAGPWDCNRRKKVELMRSWESVGSGGSCLGSKTRISSNEAMPMFREDL